MSGVHENDVRALLLRLLAAMDPALEHAARHPDCVIEIPQSGERMTRDALRDMQERFPGGPPRIDLRGLTGAGDTWAAEMLIHYADGSAWYGVNVLTFRGPLIAHETRYYAEPFDVPAWRSTPATTA